LQAGLSPVTTIERFQKLCKSIVQELRVEVYWCSACAIDDQMNLSAEESSGQGMAQELRDKHRVATSMDNNQLGSAATPLPY